MTTIVVPLDRSRPAERALLTARELARRTGAAIVLVTATWDQEHPDAAAYLDGLTQETPLLDVTTRCRSGRPSDVVLDVVGEVPDPLLCMTTHGRTGVARLVMGSVTEDVVSRAPCPVVLVGPRCSPASLGRPGAPVLGCVDGSVTADGALPTVASLARALDAPVTLVQVVDPTDPDPLGRLQAGRQADLAARGLAERAEEVRRAGGPEPERLVLPASWPAPTITRVAGELPAAAIVLATHGRTGLARTALGSIAAGVVHRSPCPVVVVPPGAVGPRPEADGEAEAEAEGHRPSVR